MFYKSAGSQLNYEGYIWVWAWILGLVTEWSGPIQASTEQDPAPQHGPHPSVMKLANVGWSRMAWNHTQHEAVNTDRVRWVWGFEQWALTLWMTCICQQGSNPLVSWVKIAIPNLTNSSYHVKNLNLNRFKSKIKAWPNWTLNYQVFTGCVLN